jgi:tetratricopeptide (TPR) repeat protein
LAAVSSTTEDVLLDALDEASAAQLIRPHTGGAAETSFAGEERFAFTHDKIREVLYEELNPIRRRRLHLRIGETLEQLYGASAADEHAQDLAHHFMHAGELSKSLLLCAPLRRRTPYASSPTTRRFEFLEQAREAAEALQRVEDVHRIDVEMGDICEARGTTQLAVRSYERALATATEAARSGAINAKIGTTYCNVGDPRGMPYLEAALATLDPARPTNELAVATASMGRYYHYRTQHRKAIEFFQRAASSRSRSTTWRRWRRSIRSWPAVISISCCTTTAIDGTGEHGVGRTQEVSRCPCLGDTSSFRRTTRPAANGTAPWPTLRGIATKAARRARSPVLHGADSPLRKACMAGRAHRRTKGGGRSARVVGANRRGAARDLARSDGGDHRGGHGRRRRGERSCRSGVGTCADALATRADGVGSECAGRCRAAPRLMSPQRSAGTNSTCRSSRHGEPRVPAPDRGLGGRSVPARRRLDEAFALAAEATELGEFAKAPLFRAMGRRIEAEILGAEKRYDEALGLFEEAIGSVHRVRQRARARARPISHAELCARARRER